jgi:hypothetical protein
MSGFMGNAHAWLPNINPRHKIPVLKEARNTLVKMSHSAAVLPVSQVHCGRHHYPLFVTTELPAEAFPLQSLSARFQIRHAWFTNSEQPHLSDGGYITFENLL